MLTCIRVCYLNDAQNDLSLRPGPGDSNVSRCTGEKLLLCIASLGCVHFWEMKERFRGYKQTNPFARTVAARALVFGKMEACDVRQAREASARFNLKGP